MLTFLKAFIQKMKTAKSQYQSDIDRYISSKNPTTVGEIEFWLKEYDRKNGGHLYGR